MTDTALFHRYHGGRFFPRVPSRVVADSHIPDGGCSKKRSPVVALEARQWWRYRLALASWISYLMIVGWWSVDSTSVWWERGLFGEGLR